jgi:chromatin segregation and condensation protein Rec8/ScpA/Scc1 (kleisin family)
MLLLNNKGYVTLQQDEPFADVLLHRTAALSL